MKIYFLNAPFGRGTRLSGRGYGSKDDFVIFAIVSYIFVL